MGETWSAQFLLYFPTAREFGHGKKEPSINLQEEGKKVLILSVDRTKNALFFLGSYLDLWNGCIVYAQRIARMKRFRIRSTGKFTELVLKFFD